MVKGIKSRYNSSLLKPDKSGCVHFKNVQYILAEICEVNFGLSHLIISNILNLAENTSYN